MSEINETIRSVAPPAERPEADRLPRRRRVEGFLQDLGETWQRRRLVMRLALEDIAKRYRGSVLGPFWVTVSLAVKVGTLAAIYPGVLGADWRSYVPFMAIGFIVWNFIFALMTEGAHVLISAAPNIKQLKLPFTLYISQLVLRNVIVLLHTAPVYIFIAILLHITPTWECLALIPAVILLTWHGFWIGLLLAPICLRYRDLPEFVNTTMLIFFFITPIFWEPKAEQLAHIFIRYNPFFHAISIFRAPLLGQSPPLYSWAFLIALAVVGTVVAANVFRALRGRIAFWA